MKLFQKGLKIFLIFLFIIIFIFVSFVVYIDYFKAKKTPLFGCPVTKEFCKAKRDVSFVEKTVGVGFKLPKNVNLLAVLDGEPELGAGITKDGSRFKNIYLKNKDGYEVIYSFYGNIDNNLRFDVKKGKVLGTVSDDQFFKGWDTSLIIMVKKNKEYISISKDDFSDY